MKKKIILSSILLLVLLLELSSNTYADTYRTWTLSDLKNVLINSVQEKTNFNIETAKEKLDLQDTNLELVLDDLNNYGYNYISWRTSGFDVDFQFFDTNNLTYSHPYLSSNALVFLHTPTGKFTNITYNGGDWYFSFQSNINNPTSFSHVNNIYYSGTNVYQNYNTNSSIIRNGGSYSPSTLFEEIYYSNSRFDITINTDNNTQYVYIDTETGNRITNIPIITNNNFGYLTDTTYIYYIDDLLGFWYYTNNTWKYKIIYNNPSDSVLLKSNNYITFIYDTINNNEICNISIKDIYTYNNVVYHFSVTNAQLDSATCYFIIGDNNTIIKDGTINTSGEYFNNGEYKNQFNELDNQINENNNTNKIVETIQRLTEPSGEVIKETIEDLYNSIEFYSGDISGELATTLAGLETILENGDDFKISWQPLETHFTRKGEPITQIIIPSGEINFSKLERENTELQETMKYTRAILTVAVYTLLLKDVWHTLMLTFGVSVQVYNREQEEKETLIAQQRTETEKRHKEQAKSARNRRKWWNWYRKEREKSNGKATKNRK